ncbi:UNVERIFIED_CONTAM: late secretory pathway protein avl9 [Siphonaria sp. JEL0065]|nr:late secretory pathway protein avl9 [Siphonaria sp. JEL0065]KAJ3030046.1 late secretory pathway protein avl9 [Siphonaria sp. JEL0065]
MVQKAVVVLSTEPLFGAQGLEFYGNLRNTYHSYISDQDLHSLHLRETVSTFKGSLLQIYKLLLLERRVLFFGTNTTRLGETQYGVLSLLPGLLRSFCSLTPQDSLANTESAADLTNASSSVHLERLGLPLKLFEEGSGSLFLPFISLHQIELLTNPDVRAWVFGTSNSIFAVQRGANIDAIVNTDTGAIDLINSDLSSAISMTGADRAFIEEVVDAVIDSWDYDHDDLNVDQLGDYEGSDNYIRTRFEEYTSSLLVTTKHAMLAGGGVEDLDLDTEVVDKDLLADFNYAWIDIWMQTENYKKWLSDPLVNPGDLLTAPGHPKHGVTDDDSVTSALKGLRTTLAPIQSNLSKAFVQAEAGIASAVTNLTSAEQREKLEKAVSTARGAAETTLTGAKEAAQDFGKVAEQAFSTAGKAAEVAALNTAKVAQEGFATVVAGLKDPNVMQENAAKAIENVSSNAKKLWTSVGAWGGGWFDSLTDLQKQQEAEQDNDQKLKKNASLAEHEPFVVGDDASSTQNLLFHSSEDRTASPAAENLKTDKKGRGEEGEEECLKEIVPIPGKTTPLVPRVYLLLAYYTASTSFTPLRRPLAPAAIDWIAIKIVDANQPPSENRSSSIDLIHSF